MMTANKLATTANNNKQIQMTMGMAREWSSLMVKFHWLKEKLWL